MIFVGPRPEVFAKKGPKAGKYSQKKIRSQLGILHSTGIGDRFVTPSEFAYMEGEQNHAYYAGEHNVYFGGLRHLFHLANNLKCTTHDCYAAFSDTR